MSDTDRHSDGRFAVGNSGGGRKRGSIGANTKFNTVVHDGLKELASPALAVIKGHLLVDNSLKTAMWILERFLPSERLIDLGTTDPMAYADALATGDMSVGEVQKAAGALKIIADASEVQELRTRLDEIESLLAARHRSS